MRLDGRKDIKSVKAPWFYMDRLKPTSYPLFRGIMKKVKYTHTQTNKQTNTHTHTHTHSKKLTKQSWLDVGFITDVFNLRIEENRLVYARQYNYV